MTKAIDFLMGIGFVVWGMLCITLDLFSHYFPNSVDPITLESIHHLGWLVLASLAVSYACDNLLTFKKN